MLINNQGQAVSTTGAKPNPATGVSPGRKIFVLKLCLELSSHFHFELLFHFLPNFLSNLVAHFHPSLSLILYIRDVARSLFIHFI